MSTTADPVGLRVLAHAIAAVTVGSITVMIIGGLLSGESFSDGLPYLLLLVVTLAVGWLLALRLAHHPIGWILMAIPALFVLVAPLGLLAEAVRPTAPGLAQWILWYTGSDRVDSWSWVPPVWLLLVQLPLRFPDGRLPSPRWRWFSRVTVVSLLLTIFYLGTSSKTVDTGVPNPVYIEAIGIEPSLQLVFFGLFAACFAVCISSLVVRYRHADALGRAQVRWMLWAVVIAIAALVLSWPLPFELEWLQSWVLLAYALIPIAIGIAVLRYRLYEIDRLISRTAAYAIVTLVVIGTYALVVLLISLLIPGAQEHTPPVVVALATLAAATVFLPALRWIRRLIDRVFNRSQYDAERVVVAFGERIRNGADPHTAGIDLIGAVGQTLQPSAIGLWVRRDRR